MRKLLTGFFLLVALLADASHAKAQTQVTLNANASGSITFSSTGVSFNNVSGVATTIAPAGSYTYAFASGGPTNVTLTAAGGGLYTASNTPITVSITGGSGTLTGTMILVDLQQVSTSGLVNTSMTANLTVTSATGTLSSYQSAGSGPLTLVLSLGFTTPINQLTGPGAASVLVGSLTPSPEPGTMVLYGSGLLLLGGLVRRRVLRS